MKNIHVLPTDKPSRLFLGNNGNFVFGMIKTSIQSRNDDFTNQNIYITSDEEIKDIRPHGGKWQLEKGEILNKVIMTTDQDLIKNGVQAIDDEFLEWFVKNPSCESVEVVKDRVFRLDEFNQREFYNQYKITIPKEENIYDEYLKDELKKYKDVKTIVFNKPKQEILLEESLEEAAKKWLNKDGLNVCNHYETIPSFIAGAKWQQERSYSEEEALNLIIECSKWLLPQTDEDLSKIKQWFNKVKKN